MGIDIVGFILGIWQEVIAAVIVAAGGAAILWLRTTTFIKRKAYTHLKAIEAEHQKCELKYNTLKADLDSLRELCAPYLEQQRKKLLRPIEAEIRRKLDLNTELDPNARLSEVLKPIEVNRAFDPRAQFKK